MPSFSGEAEELRRRIDACTWIGPEIVLAFQGVSCQIFVLECKVKSLVAHYLVCWTTHPMYAAIDFVYDSNLSRSRNDARRHHNERPPGWGGFQPHQKNISSGSIRLHPWIATG